ncbi:MAG TPA: DUF4410 domain-containing protein [Steroidobacteraceae bacterium]|nr:DUF4410 domain-containing protein [Steroidobacteraceae bacterium]
MRVVSSRSARLSLVGAVLLASFGVVAAPTNPPPARPLQGYAGYELKDVTFDPSLADKKNFDKVVAKVDENMKQSVNPILQSWNASADAHAAQKIVIEPRITNLHKPSGATRFFAGAFAGDGYINMTVRIVEQPSGKVIAEPEFYRRAAAMAGAWTVGGHDNAMLQKIAGLVANYLSANYSEAVGGPTGYEP